MPKGTNFCFTLNLSNQQATAEEAKEEFKPWEGVTYYCYQLEKGEEDGRLHLQGFVQCKTLSFKQFKEKFGTGRVHVEAAKALDLEKARDYCKKADTRVDGGGPWENGTFRNRAQPGKRTDLDIIVTGLSKGEKLDDLAKAHGATFVRNYRGLQVLEAIYNPPAKRQARPANIWVYSGVSGSGKSRRARARAGDRVYLKSAEDWWCGYDSRKHDYVLFEEFEGPEWLPPAVLLQVVDRYPTTVRQRGKESVQLSCLNYVFTTNLGVKNWYKGTKYENQWYKIDYNTGEETGECKYRAFMRRLQEGGGEVLSFDKHWDDQEEDEQASGFPVKEEVDSDIEIIEHL